MKANRDRAKKKTERRPCRTDQSSRQASPKQTENREHEAEKRPRKEDVRRHREGAVDQPCM